MYETHATGAQLGELHLPGAAAPLAAGTENIQPGGTVSLQPRPFRESERVVQVVLPEEEQIMTCHERQDPDEPHRQQTHTSHPVYAETFAVPASTGFVPFLRPVAQSTTVGHVQSARRGTTGLPAGELVGLTVAVRSNPSQTAEPATPTIEPSRTAQPATPTIEPGLPVQEVGGSEGFLDEPEEPEHPHQPLQDYIIVFASQPSN